MGFRPHLLCPDCSSEDTELGIGGTGPTDGVRDRGEGSGGTRASSALMGEVDESGNGNFLSKHSSNRRSMLFRLSIII